MAGITVRGPLFNTSWTDDQSLIRRPWRFRVKLSNSWFDLNCVDAPKITAKPRSRSNLNLVEAWSTLVKRALTVVVELHHVSVERVCLSVCCPSVTDIWQFRLSGCSLCQTCHWLSVLLSFALSVCPSVSLSVCVCRWCRWHSVSAVFIVNSTDDTCETRSNVMYYNASFICPISMCELRSIRQSTLFPGRVF